MLEFRKLGEANGHAAWGYDVQEEEKGDYYGRLINSGNHWIFYGYDDDSGNGMSSKHLNEIARFMNGLELDAVRARRKNARRK